MLVSIVIPCYNSEYTIRDVVESTIKEFEKIDSYLCEIILVNDYSKDNTFEVIKNLCEKYEFVKGIDLARNFGQHNALMTALNYTQGDIIIGMDDDLQTHPSQIHNFIKKMNEGYDIVYGKYKDKKHSYFRNLESRLNDITIRMLLKKPKGLRACSFWAIKKYIRDEIVKYKNYNVHLQGLFLRTTARICNVDIEHFERKVGVSNYTLKKLFRLWAGCINFSIIPLRVSLVLGGILSATGFIGAIVVIIKKILNVNMQVGWPSIMCALFIFFGCTLMVLGIIGEYIGRIFLCINKEPQYVIREKVNIK